MKEFIENVDYQKALHSNYDRVNEYMEQVGLKEQARVSVRSAIQSMNRCVHIDETITQLEEGLGRTNLTKSMKLYRAIKSSTYLERIDGKDLNSLIGKKLSNDALISTSLLYDCSFAKYDNCDTVFELYVPQGSRGYYIAKVSAYNKIEQEVVLSPVDIYITDVQTGIIDKNGKKEYIKSFNAKQR